MRMETCGTCKHWLADEQGARGACAMKGAQWAGTYRSKRGYGPGVPEMVEWTVAHMADSGAPACGFWRERMEVGA